MSNSNSGCKLHLSVTVMCIVGARWERGARTIERQFMEPIHVRGEAADVLPVLTSNLEVTFATIIDQIERAEASANRGYTYKFPKMGELIDGPSKAMTVAAEVHIPEPTPEQREAVRLLLQTPAAAT